MPVIVELLCSTPETNIVLEVNCTSVKKEEKAHCQIVIKSSSSMNFTQ